MLTQALAWTATVLGLASTWLCGRHHRSGWALGVACCATWIAVNWRLGVWAGVFSAVVAGVLAAWNWHRWRSHALQGSLESLQPRRVPERIPEDHPDHIRACDLPVVRDPVKLRETASG